MMKSTTTALLFLLVDYCSFFVGTVSSQLSFAYIAGYGPRSKVTDHAAIDLDQREIDYQLDSANNNEPTDNAFQIARDIYEKGAFSKSIAVITLDKPLLVPIKQGLQVTGFTGKMIGPENKTKERVEGTIVEDTAAGERVIKVQYETSKRPESYSNCQVGANPTPNLDGCFQQNGTLTIDGVATPVGYEYDKLKHNQNLRTIQKFSTHAKELMYDCITNNNEDVDGDGVIDTNCEYRPYPTYDKFYKYYGDYKYADEWILAAFEERETMLSRGNGSFDKLDGIGRAEIVKKGTAYMSVWMYVIREMEDALEDCDSGCSALDGDCNSDPVHAWDEAVAFYTGSLEGMDGSGSGHLLYALADKRCVNFRTCGDLANSDTGTSHVNIEIFRNFEDGLRKILNGQCDSARQNKVRIEELMAVPLIQGTLRYAYKRDYEHQMDDPKAEAEGAAFAAAVLPLVHACSEFDATTIHYNMGVGSINTEFHQVKRAFERNYECMGIRCADVGGVYDGANQKYLERPCSSGNSLGVQVALLISATFGAITMFF